MPADSSALQWNCQWTPGNRVHLLCSGVEYFPALLRAIDQASIEIHLETYIYAGDSTGVQVTDALVRAAQRGVRVQLIIDGYGAHDMPSRLRTQLKQAGVRLLVFRPDISLRLKRHRLRRMHRKLVVIDARIGFVGGINIIDDMDTPHQTPPRFDYAVQIEGPLVSQMHAAAERLWRLVAWARLQQRWREERAVPESPKLPQACGPYRAAFLLRDNLRHRRDIEQAYLQAIESAQDEIIIANAYFLPGWRFRRALIDAATRGVRVTLLLQGRIEYVLLHYASRALYGPLLQAGVHIYEYQRSFLHAKVAVIDSCWSTVGSSNIDPFSLALAREANVVVYDAGFGQQLRASLMQALESGAQVVLRSRWVHQPWWRRVPIWIGYGLARLLMGLAGYGDSANSLSIRARD